MREIKFRAWDKEESEITYGVNIYKANYFMDLMGHIWDIEKNILLDARFVLMQYTGLKDKNSKEIFEGDIIKVKEINWLVEPINSLERDKENYGLCVSPNGNGENYFIDKSILAGEVIGNIYENPELLK